MARTRADRSEEEPRPRRVAFLGFGLIGASIAMALRGHERALGLEPSELRAWTPAGHGPAHGRSVGLLDAAPPTPEATIEGADLVVLAGPPQAVLDDLDDLAGRWREALGEALVTDVASTKARIVARAAERGVRFVGGHPMAGREATGAEAASAALFAGRPWAVVPPNGHAADDMTRSAADILMVEQLARATGADPLRLSAAEHDAAVAAISHLPLLASVALVEAVAGELVGGSGSVGGASYDGSSGGATLAWRLAASGWRDMTRLAAGSPEMAAGIVSTNTDELLPRLRAILASLDDWIAVLEGEPGADLAALRSRFERARDVAGRTRGTFAGDHGASMARPGARAGGGARMGKGGGTTPADR